MRTAEPGPPGWAATIRPSAIRRRTVGALTPSFSATSATDKNSLSCCSAVVISTHFRTTIGRSSAASRNESPVGTRERGASPHERRGEKGRLVRSCNSAVCGRPPRGPILAQTSSASSALECGAGPSEGSDLCLECGFVVLRRQASSSSARLPKPKVAGSRPVVRFEHNYLQKANSSRLRAELDRTQAHLRPLAYLR
jgi:hypothetical protein